MKYSDFSIGLVLEQLQTQSLRDRTPKKYANPMFQAWEIIRQLQKEIAALSAENESLKTQVAAFHAENNTQPPNK